MSVEDFVVQITNEAILLTILMSGPTILVSMGLGLIVALFSATTQIQEQTLSFVPKMVAVFAVIAATGSWMGATMIRFTARCLNGIIDVIH
jgi:flagellar biosynthetic protein FliQ